MHEVVYLVLFICLMYVCWHEASASFTWIFAGEILYAITSYFALLKINQLLNCMVNLDFVLFKYLYSPEKTDR